MRWLVPFRSVKTRLLALMAFVIAGLNAWLLVQIFLGK